MSLRAAFRPEVLGLATVLAVAAAYQVPGRATLSATGPLSADAFRGFSGEEAGFRWSGAHSAIVFRDPGPGVRVRVEVDLAGWRPRGQAAPLVVLTANGRTVNARVGAGGERLALETVTPGVMRSDLAVVVRSETFRPGPRDPRQLGVRVSEARLIPLSPAPHRPPLAAPVLAGGAVFFLYLLLVHLGASARGATLAAAVLGLGTAVAFAAARPWAALLVRPLFLLLLAATLLAFALPRPARALAGFATRAARAWATGGRRLADPWTAALVLLTLAAVTVAYRIRPRLEIDLGSGREAAVARGFGVFDSMADSRCRRAPRGAELDLSDFGGGTRWDIEAVASLQAAPRPVTVLRGRGVDLVASLQDGQWSTGSARIDAPFGWRSGLRLTVPQGSDALRIDRVTIDRGPALPSLRIAACVLAIVLLVVVLFGAAGLHVWAGRIAAAVMALGVTHVIGANPIAAIPFVPAFLGIVAAGSVLAAAAGTAAAAMKERGLAVAPSALAIGAAACGFVAWLTITAFPLYRGGHFVYHSSIADEIWKGRFLIYYLPYPGSMLSEQAHWGNIKVPHPCLYQTLAAPLAALPLPLFYLSEKAILALMFASLVLIASALAARTAGPTASAFAAVAAALLLPSFQLLGLGHLMTILGVWASSLAWAWLAFRGPRLSEWTTWSVAVLLLTFCFLSYFAALLFTGLGLVLLMLILVREDRTRARYVFTATAAASVLAFLLYYVNWAWPFLVESIPRILGGSGTESTPLLRRLSQEPAKLSYSFGSLVIPLAGLAGLAVLPKSWERRVLAVWAAILPIICGGDLFFNFILKHHYYVLVPVSVGLGTLLAHLWATTRAARVAAVASLILLLVLAAHTASLVATGSYPYHLGH